MPRAESQSPVIFKRFLKIKQISCAVDASRGALFRSSWFILVCHQLQVSLPKSIRKGARKRVVETVGMKE